jgi:hypothetical protein
LLELSRVDLGWAAVTGLASAVLFATALTSHPGLGDSPEAVAGVRSLGILHAPGYPAYVLTARAFTLLVPVGNMAFRVNLFSLVCAALSIAGVQLLARRCGAARWAASLGALVLAVSGGFWFYATFAKADTFSGLLFLVTLHLALAWRARPTTGRLVGLAVGLGVGLGSSWPLMVLIGPMIAFVLIAGRRGLSLRALATATATGLVILVGIYGFVLVRAAENPPINWGQATTVSRLIDLVGRRDFSSHGSPSAKSATPTAGVGSPLGAGSGVIGAKLAGRGGNPPAATVTTGTAIAPSISGYGVIFGRELGILGLLLAAFGLIASLRRRYMVASYPLLIAFFANLIGAAVVVGVGSSPGSDVDLVEEGFLLGCYFVLAAWMAIGATELVAITSNARLAGRFDFSPHRRLVSAMVAAILVAAALVPLVPQHWSVAHRDSKPFADRYASTVFAALPQRAVMFVWGADLNLPLTYRQVVYHDRPDVTVIAVGGLRFDWYRAQVSRLLGRALPAEAADPIVDLTQVMRSLNGIRPVFVDQQATEFLTTRFKYRNVGLVAQAEPLSQAVPVSSSVALEHSVLAAERAADMPSPAWNGWPNSYLNQAEYATAELKVARAYYQQHDLVGMRRALTNVLSIEPGDSTAAKDLALLNGQAGG